MGLSATPPDNNLDGALAAEHPNALVHPVARSLAGAPGAFNLAKLLEPMQPKLQIPGLARGICGWSGLLYLSLLTLFPAVQGQVVAPRLEIGRPPSDSDWVRLGSPSQSNMVFSLEASTNLTLWQSIGVFHNALFNYPDLASGGLGQRFYRLTAAQRRLSDDWKNQLVFPGETFRSTNSLTDIAWVKFSILVGEPARVYYQDSAKYPFHFQFATQRLAPFKGMDPATFEQVSMHRSNQQIVLGTVLYPPGADFTAPWIGSFSDCGIQFDGVEPYTPDEIARWFALVKATVFASSNVVFYYMPTFEQSAAARDQADAFVTRGISVSSVDHWISVGSCYAPGWALGRLKYFPAPDIVAAFSDGRLEPGDILLTDGVPADAPIVAGIITLAPSTPNSHTAILSQSFGAPFVYLPTASAQAHARALIGHRVVLRASVTQGVSQVKIVDVDGSFTPAFESELLAFRAAGPINFIPKQPYGSIWAATDGLGPTDIRYFGGKAANYGMLRRSVPTNCPVAIAFSFDLWDAFLDQTLPGGKTLRVEIANRLARYTNYPPDIAPLKADLAAIRDLFTKTASLTPAQQAAITNALAIFSPRRNLRFRSSTNLEDTERFTGAGLYDSFSGCLMDDLDGDDAGPCQCEPDTSKEHGVFRALQKVYASYYNDDAYLARLSHRVDETKAGMGVLVHHSFPDDEELANGVATPRFDFKPGNTNVTGEMVTQLGAASVTNPDGTSVPEVVSVSGVNDYTSLRLKQGSSLVPLGGFVMVSPSDYETLVRLFTHAAQGFHQLYPARTSLFLDFEYKKDTRSGLVVKQVRQLPQPGSSSPTTAFLIDEPVVCELEQYGPVFRNHRLKSVWTLHSPNMRLVASNLTHGVYAQSSLEYLDYGEVQILSGPMNSWPNASNSLDGSTNTWTTGSGAAQRRWEMGTSFKTTVAASEPPILTLADFRRTIVVTYATPVPIRYGETLTNTVSETAYLRLRDDDVSSSIRREWLFVKTNVVAIQTTYYWPKPPVGLAAIYTPLQRFVETRITGLTSNPIVLTNYYSQSYGACCHNAMEDFLFEPRLEPGLPAATLAELEAGNIQLIYVSSWGGRAEAFYVIGFDQTLRRL